MTSFEKEGKTTVLFHLNPRDQEDIENLKRRMYDGFVKILDSKDRIWLSRVGVLPLTIICFDGEYQMESKNTIYRVVFDKMAPPATGDRYLPPLENVVVGTHPRVGNIIEGYDKGLSSIIKGSLLSQNEDWYEVIHVDKKRSGVIKYLK